MDHNNLAELEQQILAPSLDLIEDIKKIQGDILFLGIGGKMGPSMAKLAMRAIQAAGIDKKVIGVSRFSTKELQQELEDLGIETIACDLLNEEELKKIPQVPNVIYLAGHKFGTTGNEDFTWAMNTYLPGMVGSHFRDSNIVAFSSGNVLPFVPISNGGVSEERTPEPVGEYAQSCLGRERIFEYFSKKNGTPTLIYRLNYAVDFRYGQRAAPNRFDNRKCQCHLAGRCQRNCLKIIIALSVSGQNTECHGARNPFYTMDRRALC